MPHDKKVGAEKMVFCIIDTHVLYFYLIKKYSHSPQYSHTSTCPSMCTMRMQDIAGLYTMGIGYEVMPGSNIHHIILLSICKHYGRLTHNYIPSKYLPHSGTWCIMIPKDKSIQSTVVLPHVVLEVARLYSIAVAKLFFP